MSESERLRLAWALLGPVDGSDDWLKQCLDIPGKCPKACGFDSGFDILNASDELELLENTSPAAFAPRDASLLPWLVSAGTSSEEGPGVAHWSSLRALLS